MPQDWIGAPLGHPRPCLRCLGQRRHGGGLSAPRSPQDQLTWSVVAIGKLSGASARRGALGPRRLAGPAGKGGAVAWRVGMWRILPLLRSAARLASRRSPPACPQRRCAAAVGRSGGASRGRPQTPFPPPPPGAGSRQHRCLRGRRHLPRLHLSCRVDRCGRHGGGPLPGAACGGEAGAPADEAEQARAYVAWLCHHVLNPHTMRPCTLSYPQRATARTPCASSGEGQGEHDGSGASHGLSAGEVCACTVVEYVASLGTMHCVV